LAPVNLPPVRYFPPTSVTAWTLATLVLVANVLVLGGIYESENRNDLKAGLTGVPVGEKTCVD
jgi:hypothetical protein